MSISKVQAAVTARVWQEIAQSGLDISGIEKDDMNKLVQIAVDSALDEVDSQLEQLNRSERQPDTGPAAAGDDDDDAEVVLWEGRPFLSLVVNYIITNERVRIIQGLLGKEYEDIELVRVQDVDFEQAIAERALSLGDIRIISHDPSHPQATLRNIKDPKAVHEILRRAVINARKKFRLSYREEM
ncbi:MAG: PH domain-containing protein [Anaerolineae bacterium]